MEGRNPPPPAAHPFPDDADAVRRKFWGTQAARGYFRYIGVGMTLWMSLLYINYYFTKDTGTVLGMDCTLTKEQFDRRVEASSSHPAKRSMGLASITTAQNLLVPDKNQPEGYDIRFDDNVRMAPAHHLPVRRTLND